MKLNWFAKVATACVMVAGIVSPSSAALTGPYNAATQDASTTHLYHLDDTIYGTPEAFPGAGTNITADAMTTGTTFSMVNRYWVNNTLPENKAVPAKSTFGHASYSPSFGRAVRTADRWLDSAGHINVAATPPLVFSAGTDNDFIPGLYVNYDPLGAHDNVNVSTFWNQTTGAFTYEAIVQVGFDPTVDFGVTAGATTGPNYFAIIGIREDSNDVGGRDLVNGGNKLRFGLIPQGSSYHNTNSTTGLDLSDFTKPYLWVKTDGATGEEAAAQVPTTGPHALVKDGWYHVALTYNGVGGAGSTTFYWTKLGIDDATRTTANALTTTGYVGTLPSNPDQTSDFAIGNVNPRSTADRDPWAGVIDEVRISTTARGPGDFLWGASLHAGDFDGDGDVDGADFVAWQTHFPTATGATLADGDADADGDVDGADFVVWQTNFPFTPGPGAAPVPEPNAICIIGIGVIALNFARRRLVERE